LFLDAPSADHSFRLEGRLVGNAVKPIPHLGARDNRSRLAEENQECGLEGILGVRRVPQDTLAYAKNHRSVAADEQLEGRLVAVCDESFQQLGIPDPGTFVPARHVAEVTDDALKLTGRHGIPSVPKTSCSHHNDFSEGDDLLHDFSSENGRHYLQQHLLGEVWGAGVVEGCGDGSMRSGVPKKSKTCDQAEGILIDCPLDRGQELARPG
jgi:hypothetical protein